MLCVNLGNGPSGICLSYLLSGYKPYLDPSTAHPNPILYRKLQEMKNLPITEQVKIYFLHMNTWPFSQLGHNRDFCSQDLEYLSEGLEGRSRNPVAVLFDTLLHPNADFGYEFPPVLQWRKDKQQHIPHLVLGKATPGGAWHVSYMAYYFSVICLSFALLMSLLTWHCLNISFPPLGNGRLHANYQPWHLDGASRGQLQRLDEWKTQVKKKLRKLTAKTWL